MFSNLAYLLTSKSITLYILYTLHVMLGTSLVFTALYTYGLHSSKAMARAAALEASIQASGTGACGISAIGNGSAVEFENDMDGEMHREDIAIGGLEGRGRVGRVVGLSVGRVGWENGSVGLGGEGADLGVERWVLGLGRCQGTVRNRTDTMDPQQKRKETRNDDEE